MQCMLNIERKYIENFLANRNTLYPKLKHMHMCNL